eukprot:CAMPEP_0183421624 /NCGR_PEP_ID=MMETSP0370-20130417/27234_1 /TAXON_ID=268820 /ORGANISM="Peridinium aciculiferum, Strain PAER-2" /LENGTH=138 /DNA_ID=CAMNT_0025605633 /DNA_START=87 /DNA_END=500 /DNA_ORIENTATION=-
MTRRMPHIERGNRSQLRAATVQSTASDPTGRTRARSQASSGDSENNPKQTTQHLVEGAPDKKLFAAVALHLGRQTIDPERLLRGGILLPQLLKSWKSLAGCHGQHRGQQQARLVCDQRDIGAHPACPGGRRGQHGDRL